MPDSIQASNTVYFASFAALLGALSVGLALGYTAPAFYDMENNGPDDILSKDSTTIEERKGWIGSSLAIGAAVGGIITDPSNNYLGRRLSMITFGVPFALSWLIIAIAPSVHLIIVGRILKGLCAGLICGIAPTYVVEIAPPKIRGLLGTCFQLMVVIGILIEAVVGKYASWRVLAGINIIFGLAMSCLMLFMPETPQWLLSKGKNPEAEHSLKKLRSGSVSNEFTQMTETAANSGQSNEYSIAMLTNIQFYKPMTLSLALMFFQQFSGVNAVLFYQTDIFKSVPGLDPIIGTIVVCVAQVLATAVGSALVDLLGRRVLLLVSGSGHAISLVMFGFCRKVLMSNASNSSDLLPYLSLASLIIFISSFSIGYGPIPWMMVPELSPPHLRSIVASIATTFNWVCVFIVTVSVKPLINRIGDPFTYWLFALICAGSCVFVVLSLPETKGKTSEQIQSELLGLRDTQSTQAAVEGSNQRSMKAMA